MKISSVDSPLPNTCSHVPDVFIPDAAPRLTQFLGQGVFVLLKVCQKLCRDLSRKCFLRFGTIVPRLGNHPDFILHLNHHDGVLLPVDYAEVLHESGECLCVGISVFIAERSKNLDGSAVFGPCTRKPLLIRLDPGGRIARHAVLPRTKPQDDDLQVILARRSDEVVDERKIKFPFLRFDELPVHRHQNRIHVHRFQLRPDGRHVLHIRCA